MLAGWAAGPCFTPLQIVCTGHMVDLKMYKLQSRAGTPAPLNFVIPPSRSRR